MHDAIKHLKEHWPPQYSHALETLNKLKRIEVKLNPKTSKRRGQCKWKRRGEDQLVEIELSKKLFRDVTKPDRVGVSLKSLLETICHEVAHAAHPPKEGHSKDWSELMIALCAIFKFKSEGTRYDGSLENAAVIGGKIVWTCDKNSSHVYFKQSLDAKRCRYKCPHCEGGIMHFALTESGKEAQARREKKLEKRRSCSQ